MRIVLLGATGFVGAALLSEALSRGHEVMAIARHPEKLEGRENLAVKAGDVYDTDGLASLIAGHDALISAFNPGWTPGTQRPEMYDEQVRGTSSIIAAAKKAGIKRVLWVGGAGGLEVVRREGDRLARFPGVDQARLQSHKQRPGGTPERAGATLVFLAPSAVLEPGQRTGKFRLGGDQLLVDAKGESRISVEDYAAAMLDELEQPKHVRQRFTVGY